MDDIVKEARPGADERFDSARITVAVDALAAEHAGREDVFRAAVAKLLKQLIDDPQVAARCREIAARLQGTDPLSAACQAIEALT